jgi:hypothetical protein
VIKAKPEVMFKTRSRSGELEGKLAGEINRRRNSNHGAKAFAPGIFPDHLMAPFPVGQRMFVFLT